LFFPSAELHSSKAGARNRAVIDDYCSRCPVRQECNAVGANEPTGIWGGELRGAAGRRIKTLESV
jgi:hypothetical protein